MDGSFLETAKEIVMGPPGAIGGAMRVPARTATEAQPSAAASPVIPINDGDVTGFAVDTRTDEGREIVRSIIRGLAKVDPTQERRDNIRWRVERIMLFRQHIEHEQANRNRPEHIAQLEGWIAAHEQVLSDLRCTPEERANAEGRETLERELPTMTREQALEAALAHIDRCCAEKGAA